MKTKIVYPLLDQDSIDEYEAMHEVGFEVGDKPSIDAINIYRGPCIRSQSQYPNNCIWLNSWENNRRTLFFSEFFHLIESCSIPSFIVDKLDDSVPNKIQELGWTCAFIRSDSKSLYFHDFNSCLWPVTSISKMVDLYKYFNLDGPFIVRKFINDKEIFYEEQRFWVLNGRTYHPSGKIPEWLKEIAIKIYRFSGSNYFTIDVAGNYIVEINPGESSDRGCENPLEFFCEIFKQEFINRRCVMD